MRELCPRRAPSHRGPRSAAGPSVRLRALLALGVLGTALVGGTFAFWTDTATVTGGTFTSGTLDLEVDGADSLTTTTLPMAAMAPGSTSAEVVDVSNAGNVPLLYSVAGGLSGSDSTLYDSSGALLLTIVKDGTRSGSGDSATCTGGTTLLAATALTTTSTSLITGRGPLAAADSESLCLQVTLASDAPSSLQGKATDLTLAVSGTSDVG